jgi:hypothetical protein
MVDPTLFYAFLQRPVKDGTAMKKTDERKAA